MNPDRPGGLRQLFWILLFFLPTIGSSQELPISPFPGRLPWADPVGVFAKVFAELPDKVTILPTENYCYWTSTASGVKIRGNLRFPPNLRERGSLGFGYEEQVEDPFTQEKQSNAQVLGAADGVTVEQGSGPLEWKVRYGNRTVVFLLPALEQSLPPGFVLAAEERFVERIRDESGLQFVLLFSQSAATFLWVLDERQTELCLWDEVAHNLVLEKRTQFIFLREKNRRILAGVSRKHILQNNSFDGPFDQLADQAALQSGRLKYLTAAFPGVAGGMDAYGEYLEEGKSKRVAITPYFRYKEAEEVVQALKLDADAWKVLGPLTMSK